MFLPIFYGFLRFFYIFPRCFLGLSRGFYPSFQSSEVSDGNKSLAGKVQEWLPKSWPSESGIGSHWAIASSRLSEAEEFCRGLLQLSPLSEEFSRGLLHLSPRFLRTPGFMILKEPVSRKTKKIQKTSNRRRLSRLRLWARIQTRVQPSILRSCSTFAIVLRTLQLLPSSCAREISSRRLHMLQHGVRRLAHSSVAQPESACGKFLFACREPGNRKCEDTRKVYVSTAKYKFF